MSEAERLLEVYNEASFKNIGASEAFDAHLTSCKNCRLRYQDALHPSGLCEEGKRLDREFILAEKEYKAANASLDAYTAEAGKTDKA